MSRGTHVGQVPTDIEEFRASDIQRTVRSAPSALLARRVVVTEGKTELGVCRALVEHWDSTSSTPMPVVGTAFALGGGSDAPRRAQCLAALGYPTALLIDDDLG